MNWPDNILQPVERYIFEGDIVRIGLFDCHKDETYFAVTEPVADNMFVLATRPVWIRRRTAEYQYVSPGSVLFHTAGCSIERKRTRADRDLAYWFAIKRPVFAEALSRRGYDEQVPTDSLASDPAIHLQIAEVIRCITNGESEPYTPPCES